MPAFEDQTTLRMPMQKIQLQWNPVTEAYEPQRGLDGAVNIRLTKAIAAIEARAIMGVVTALNASGLTDADKDFAADLLNGKFIKVRHSGKDYYRVITDTSGSALLFSALIAEVAEVPAVAAHAVIGAAPGGIATIRCKTGGVAGNAYSVEVIAGTGISQSLGVSLTESLLTITSPTDGAGAPTAVAAANLEALFAGVPAVNAVFDVDNDITAGEIALTVAAVEFEGGVAVIPVVPAVTAAVADEYEVLL